MGHTSKDDNQDWYVLIAGFPPFTSPALLAPGIVLKPLESKLTVFDLAAAGGVGFRGWAALEQFIPACSAELQSASDAASMPGYNALNRAWLATGLLVLRGFTQISALACNDYSWNEIAGHQKGDKSRWHRQVKERGVRQAVFHPNPSLPAFHGKLLDYHLFTFVDPGYRKDAPSRADAEWVNLHFETYNRMAAENEAFRFALEAVLDWRFAKKPRSAISRLWSGIEAIFGINSELVFRISLSSACLLAARGDERKSKFIEVKRLYGLRSKVVHGESLPEEKIYQAMTDSFYLLRDLLILAVMRGNLFSTSDIEDAIFS